MATLKLNAVDPGDDRDSRTVDRYSLCYVLDGDCHYEMHARMFEVQQRIPSLVAAGAAEFSLLRSNGIEIATHDDLVRRVRAVPADRNYHHRV